MQVEYKNHPETHRSPFDLRVHSSKAYFLLQ